MKSGRGHSAVIANMLTLVPRSFVPVYPSVSPRMGLFLATGKLCCAAFLRWGWGGWVGDGGGAILGSLVKRHMQASCFNPSDSVCVAASWHRCVSLFCLMKVCGNESAPLTFFLTRSIFFSKRALQHSVPGRRHLTKGTSSHAGPSHSLSPRQNPLFWFCQMWKVQAKVIFKQDVKAKHFGRRL